MSDSNRPYTQLAELRSRVDSRAAPGAEFTEQRMNIITAIHAAHRISGAKAWGIDDQRMIDMVDAWLVTRFDQPSR